MADLLGKKLLNYRIEKLLGQGGMGEVYLGVHTEIERKVAIKAISPHLARDERIRERFRREALILSRLNHPNIVQLYDFWDRPEGLFLIMEYVNGIALDRYIHRVVGGPLPVKFAIDLFLQVLDAFHYAHEQGVIHRDIKPSNILIRNDNVVKILDFGIARILAGDETQDDKQKELTRTGTTLGTVAYMSPEQIRAKSPGEIDHRSDIYSLGLVLFEMLTGQPAYDRNELSEFDLLLKIATDPPPSLLSINPNLPPELDSILSRSLAKDRQNRYQSCQEFAADLIKFLAKHVQSAEASSTTSSSRNPALTTPTMTSLRPPSRLQKALTSLRDSFTDKDKSSSKGTFLRIGLVIIGIVVVLYGLFAWIRYNSAKKEALQIAHEFVEKALRQHDARMLSVLLADTLEQFFDAPRKSLPEIQKGYTDFWQDLQSDSVAWHGNLAINQQNDTWIVRGILYYHYTTKPKKLIEPKKRYNRLWGRYETYNEVKTIPPQTLCKRKSLELYIRAAKIISIRQVEERPCP